MHRLKAQTKVKTTSIVDLQYAIAAHTEAELQNTLDAEEYNLMGLSINATETGVLLQPPQPLTAIAQSIAIEGTALENVDQFSYLSMSANIDVEIQHVMIICARFIYASSQYSNQDTGLQLTRVITIQRPTESQPGEV